MKKNNFYYIILGLLIYLGACSDFEKINVDPNAASKDQINVQWMLNNSITQAQQGPHIAERIFVYNWKDAARQHWFGFITAGSYADAFNRDYLRQGDNDGISNWLKSANEAINLANEQLSSESLVLEHDKKMVPNIREVARIWRVYLMSEFVDNFGPMPLNAFEGKNPEYSSVKDIYYFMLKELTEAQATIDESVKPLDEEKKFDRAYEFDFSKWKKYANSMRMRLAMRLSEVDPAKAKSEFEAAAKEPSIKDLSENFQIKEREGGWTALEGVMSRVWNRQPVGATMSNIMVNLGGVKTADQLPAAEYASYIKPANYLGLHFKDHFPTYINDPYNGFLLDGLPYTIDPRAYKIFVLPFHEDNPFKDAADPVRKVFGFKINDKGEKVVDEKNTITTFDMKYTWNGLSIGDWGVVGAATQFQNSRIYPLLDNKYRKSKNSRVFFGAWETYFLMAEAAIRGWAVPMSGKEAYEAGIKESFKYHEVDNAFVATYLASKDYNRVGTSVAWDHTTEPPVSVEMDMIDGYTKAPGKYAYKYPIASQTLYGKALNDPLTKVITQKYLAQMPWLPLEVWSDQRRLSLPFFENPAVENPITNLPALTKENARNSQSIAFFPQRLRYPSSFENSNPDGYKKATELLGGTDGVLTPLWWAKQK